MHRVTNYLAPLVLTALIAGCSNDSPNAGRNPVAPGTIAASRDDNGQADDIDDGEGGYTLAVIGDTPYGPVKLQEFPSLIAKINADPDVRLVAHLGDIKAGKNTRCTDEYFTMIRGLFDTFSDPLVYTPGDNEWTDCHVAIKNNGLYTPTERLAKVRSLFFPNPGHSLGVNSVGVMTEADDPANSAYVENTIFRRAHVVFAAVNITGSNNDLPGKDATGKDVDIWGTPLPSDAGNYQSQLDEFATRETANEAWIEKAFGIAEKTNAAGVVLLFQADMWDTGEPTLNGFDALVQKIGSLSAQFGKPVLLLEGDSHKFRVDNPYSASSNLHGVHASTPIAENITRVVVEGSDAGRTEYLRLKIDPSRKGSLFSWERVPLN